MWNSSFILQSSQFKFFSFSFVVQFRRRVELARRAIDRRRGSRKLYTLQHQKPVSYLASQYVNIIVSNKFRLRFIRVFRFSFLWWNGNKIVCSTQQMWLNKIENTGRFSGLQFVLYCFSLFRFFLNENVHFAAEIIATTTTTTRAPQQQWVNPSLLSESGLSAAIREKAKANTMNIDKDNSFILNNNM